MSKEIKNENVEEIKNENIEEIKNEDKEIEGYCVVGGCKTTTKKKCVKDCIFNTAIYTCDN